MRILWHGVAPNFKTGYGIQTSLFTQALKRAGHEVFISSVCTSLPTYEWEGIKVLSSGPRFNMGNDWVDIHFQKYKCDVVISMMDTFVCDLKKFNRLPWVPWQVVDSQPLLNQIADSCKAAKVNLAMAKFGQGVMRQAGFDSTYIPLAFDSSDYYQEDQTECRARIKAEYEEDWQGKFVVMINAANMSKPSRKNFSCALAAFAKYHKKNPDSLLYLHTEITGQMSSGEDLRKMSAMYGLDDSCLRFPPQYEYNMGMLGADFMRTVYNAADVLLCTSRGEGFGVPLVEAQACGLPVIAPEFSASGELVFNGATLKQGIMWAYHDDTMQMICDPREVVCALQSNETSTRTVPEGVKAFEIDSVMTNQMIPFLKTLEDHPEMLTNKKEFKLEDKPNAPVVAGVHTASCWPGML